MILLVFTHVIEMFAKSLGVNCIIVKIIVHKNTVCLNINRFSTFYQEILVGPYLDSHLSRRVN